MRTALSLLDDTTLQGNIIVFQAGGDDVSVEHGRRGATAISSTRTSWCSASGLQTGDLSTGSLQDQVSATRGIYTQLDDMSKVPDTSALMTGTVNAQVLLSYTSDPAATTVDLVVTAGDQSAKATYNPGSLTFGDALSPSVYNPPLAGGPSFLSGTSGKYLGGLLALAALILLAYGIGLIFFRDRSELDNALQPYADGYVSEADEDEDAERQRARADEGAAASRRAHRAVRRRTEASSAEVEAALERADLPLRAAEAIFFYVALSVVVTALVLVLSQHLIITALVLGGARLLSRRCS